MDNTIEKVYNLISETPPDGDKFSKTVKHILNREQQWIKWKNDGCPPFTTAKEEVANTDAATSAQGKVTFGETHVDRSLLTPFDVGCQWLFTTA